MHHSPQIILSFISLSFNISLLIFLIVYYVGYPYCVYVSLLSKAEDPRGIENLARYLAKKSDMSKIQKEDHGLWVSFLPAARRLRHDFEKRRIN